MTPPQHDVIVIGLGCLGSAAARRLAERGLRVLGIDRKPRVRLPGAGPARLAGADLRFAETVIDWHAERSGTGTRVLTRSDTHTAPLLVICPGEAARTLLAGVGLPAEPGAAPVLGAHPRYPQVLVACGFTERHAAGAALVGEALADLATGRSPQTPLTSFDPRRPVGTNA